MGAGGIQLTPMFLFRMGYNVLLGFPGGSDGKESVCNAGHPGLIPG